MNGPHVQYSKIPQAQRDLIFEDFRHRFTWLPQHESRIRDNFHHRAAVRFKDMMHDFRKKGERPPCIGESDWAGMQTTWASEYYKNMSSTNKKNRTSSDSGSGASLSTSDSMPFTEHMRRLRNELDRDPTSAELHARTHRRQGTHEWVDVRSERVHEYLRMEHQYTQPDSEEGSSSGASSRPSDVEMWRRVAGGKKKGRTYGLGAKGMLTMHRLPIRQTSAARAFRICCGGTMSFMRAWGAWQRRRSSRLRGSLSRISRHP